MTATPDKLKDLHSRLTDVLSDAMEDMKLDDPLLAQANLGVMKLVSSFLKDNNITADLNTGEQDETSAALEELQKKRRKASLPTEMMN